MNDTDRWEQASRWLRYSEEDLESAHRLAREGVPRQVCWLAQQSAEKALKAVMVFLQIDFPRTHDLDTLLTLIPADWTAKTIVPDLAALTEWAVEARYPGNWPEATDAEAEAALADAEAVCQAVHNDLALKYCPKNP
jgi:HEPN domain-containing protein